MEPPCLCSWSWSLSRSENAAPQSASRPPVLVGGLCRRFGCQSLKHGLPSCPGPVGYVPARCVESLCGRRPADLASGRSVQQVRSRVVPAHRVRRILRSGFPKSRVLIAPVGCVRFPSSPSPSRDADNTPAHGPSRQVSSASTHVLRTKRRTGRPPIGPGFGFSQVPSPASTKASSVCSASWVLACLRDDLCNSRAVTVPPRD